MKVAQFFIDCGYKSGLGHLRRSLVLASSLRERGIDCKIYITSTIGDNIIDQYGFDYQLVENYSSKKVDISIIDGNNFTDFQIETWSNNAGCFCVTDDNGLSPIKCDIIINTNLYAESVCYSSYDYKLSICGPKYHLVAQEFFIEKSSHCKLYDYIISFGGTDDGSLAGPIIKKMIEKTSKSIVWVVPEHIKPLKYIVAMAEENKNFIIEIGANVPKFLAQAKCYIGGAGTMVLEAHAAGCQIVACSIVPDQKRNINYLAQNNVRAFNKYDVDVLVDAAISPIGLNNALKKLDVNAPTKIADLIIKELE